MEETCADIKSEARANGYKWKGKAANKIGQRLRHRVTCHTLHKEKKKKLI